MNELGDYPAQIAAELPSWRDLGGASGSTQVGISVGHRSVLDLCSSEEPSPNDLVVGISPKVSFRTQARDDDVHVALRHERAQELILDVLVIQDIELCPF